jgi:hypothetical protein
VGKSRFHELMSGEVTSPHAQEWGSRVSTFLTMEKSAFHVKSYVIVDIRGKVTFLLAQKYVGKSSVYLVKSGEKRVNVLISRGSHVPTC